MAPKTTKPAKNAEKDAKTSEKTAVVDQIATGAENTGAESGQAAGAAAGEPSGGESPDGDADADKSGQAAGAAAGEPSGVKSPDGDADADESGKGADAAAGESPGGDKTISDNENGTTVPAGAVMESRAAVVFLGPHTRYVRGDVATFDAARAAELVEKGVAVWPKDAKRALSPRKVDTDHDTDIG